MTLTDTDTLSTNIVAAAAGATYRRVHYWASQRTLTPKSERPLAAGSGYRWKWSREDCYQARVARLLCDLGATNDTVRPALRQLASDPSWWDCCTAMILRNGDILPLACAEQSEAGWIVNLPAVRAEADRIVDQAVAALHDARLLAG